VARDRVAQIERVALDRLGVGVAEDLRHQRAAARAGVENARREALGLAVGRQILFEKAREADDRAEEIVEIVRDAAGEMADRLHPAGVAQFPLEPRAFALVDLDLGHIRDDADRAAERQAHAANLEVAVLSVAPPHNLAAVASGGAGSRGKASAPSSREPLGAAASSIAGRLA